GWNVTGDSYLVDEDGYFWFQARADDMIITAGYNVAGPEVEAAMLSHAAVAECGVVGAPHPDRGQIVQAYVVPADGYTVSEDLTKALQDHVKQEISPYKYPRKVVYTDSLPRTETGKLRRYRLREMAAADGS
ncbi:MAG: 2-aminobenzoate-CoA ligase, partial [bacterium]|nr:2-aminobenzoate-CoA ligase [bacterium]